MKKLSMHNKLKFGFILICGVVSIQSAVAQSNLNFVRSWVAQKPIANEVDIISSARTAQEVIRMTEYIDGYGRPVQSVTKQASPALKDMVDMHVYDSWGREVQRHLPFTSSFIQSGDVTNDGNYKPTASQQQLAFNQGLYPGENNYYYAQTSFENSPVNRPLNSYAPGTNWVGSSRGVGTQYFVNTTTDNVRIWSITTTQGALPTASTAYGAGQLFKTISVDEQGNQNIKFQDKEGRVVLTKVQTTATSDNGTGSGHAGWLCTYYVYDDYNNLRYVITPQVVGYIDGTWNFVQGLADELCVRYEYDLQNRVIIKKNPGAGEKWLVYDQRNRLVMSQDANQRAAQKWQYFQYDNLDRPVATGLMYDPANFSNLPFHHASAANSIAYPNTGSYSIELLSQTYYDNYAWVGGTGLGSSLDNSNTSNTAYFYTPSNSTFPYPQAIVQSSMTRGMITGSKTEVLGSNGAQYLHTVTFYDSKARIIQTQGVNITGGVDKATTQYSWTGQTLRILEQHAKSGTNSQTHSSVTKRTYDHGGRLLTVTKTMMSTIGATNITSPEKTIATYTYNEAGQQVNKTLGTHPTTGNPLETMAYAYNLRGWLTGINKNFTQAGSTSNYFGMELAYDKTAATASTTSFSSPVYNGNMAGLIWKSKGDGVSRKYDFSYDKASRLTAGSFVQNTSGSTWDNSYMDYSVLSMSYTANSNISTLYQHGFVLGGSSNIDELSYNYEQSGASNKLKNVIDMANNPNSKIGDFHYAGSKIVSQTDYLYDGNGNKTSDANKNISSISYYLLNLPRVVTVTGKGTITYTYDAAGNKLRKEVQENNATVPFNGANYTTNITTVTTYIGGFVYQSKTFSNASLSSLNKTESLQYALTEEGRARIVYPLFGQPAYFAFDYFVRDNLGNVRVTLSDEQQQDTYPAATLESGGIGTEQSFYNIVNDANHVIATSSLPWWSSASGSSYQNNNGIPVPPDPTVNPTASSTKVYKLNGATGDRFGMGISLKVMAGDVISIFGRSAWHNNGSTTNNTSYNISSVLTSFINAFAGTNAVVNGSKGAANGTILNNNSNTTGPLTTLLNNVATPSGQTPKAYINWILFDEQFKPVTGGGGVDAINTAADIIKAHSITGINIVKSGYLYIYCSNESNQDVYFDNLQVIHNRGPLVEERHYYPDGLTMFAISNRAFGKLETSLGYQGKDFQGGEFYDGTGLEEYDFVARFYDPQLGRWWTQDPAGQFASPYNAMANNWPSYVDRDGRLAWFVPIIIGAALFGAGNLAIHAARGDIDNFWEGLGYFAQGAVVGAVVGATWSFAFAALNGSAIVGGSTLIQGMGFASHGIGHTLGMGVAIMKGVSTVTTIASIIRNPENAGRILMGNAYLDENRTFLGGIVQGISRFTWEGLQNWAGYNWSQFRNTIGQVDRVDYLAGATYVTNENFRGASVSLGNYLNINIPDRIIGDFQVRATSDPLFMHEYGHQTDSRIFGPLYLFAVGIPSAAGAEWTEIRANRFGARYFGREYGVDWTPFEIDWPRRR